MTRLPRFELHAPREVEEATDLLDRYGEDAAVYCGGTELLLLMKLGFAALGHLVDVKGIEELHGVRAVNDGLTIGAAVTHREVERSALIRKRWPALAEMERSVANIRVRNAGTLGGNLCFADPHSDPATFLLAAGATLLARRGAEARRIPANEFVLGPYRTALRGGELLAGIEIPPVPPGASVVHRKLTFHERPAVTVTCLVRAENGRVTEARIAVGSVGAMPLRVTEAELLLTGMEVADRASELLDAAGLAAAEACGATEDANGSPEYKRQLVRVLVTRAVRDAVANAR